MKTVSLQIRPDGLLQPLSIKDMEAVKSFKPNQIVVSKISGTRKPRSYLALKTYWLMCKIVSENNNNEDWQTKELVDYQLRVRLKLYDNDKIIVLKNKVVLELRSISFKNMDHLESCDYFNRAYDLINKLFQINIDDVINDHPKILDRERGKLNRPIKTGLRP